MAECRTCLYFKSVRSNKRQKQETGHCRKLPPTPKHGFPKILRSEWCGGYAQREPALGVGN